MTGLAFCLIKNKSKNRLQRWQPEDTPRTLADPDTPGQRLRSQEKRRGPREGHESRSQAGSSDWTLTHSLQFSGEHVPEAGPPRTCGFDT